ncbi:MAG: 16S rRNA (uracil(1498)-N(3))-methyltransferase [Proteobacteria bacterium]|nr:16S rRNA (uracil(1498)-N(3))-methyltransferase [Pseudomonadota bacterium]
MRIPRIFHPSPLSMNQIVELSSNAANHVSRVLRLNEEDELVLFNGEGGEYQATIHSINKQKVSVVVSAFHETQTESPLSIQLGQALVRNQKMDLILQKAVELGVKEIHPLVTERCEIHLSNERLEKRLEHWKGIIISACEQSGRNILPKVFPPMPLSQWLAQKRQTLGLILDPEGSSQLRKLEFSEFGFTLLVGPEGGLTEAEISLAKAEGFLAVKIGPRILRTETAGFTAIAGLQSLFGDL